MLSAVLGELSVLKNIPSMVIPHGSFTPVYDEYSKMEWMENALGMIHTKYKYVAVQTPLAERFLSDINCKSKAVVTGPLLFGTNTSKTTGNLELRRRYSLDEDYIILHAGTPKHRACSRLLNYETVDEYVDGMDSLINAVSKLKNIHLIIRHRNIDGLDSNKLKEILPRSDSYSIASDGIFSDYLSISDLLVSFSSTTIEEALQNNIPVLLFNKYNRYQHMRGTVLSLKESCFTPSALYNVNSGDDLLFAIKWILSNHLSKEIDPGKLFNKYKYTDSEITALSGFMKSVLE